MLSLMLLSTRLYFSLFFFKKPHLDTENAAENMYFYPSPLVQHINSFLKKQIRIYATIITITGRIGAQAFPSIVLYMENCRRTEKHCSYEVLPLKRPSNLVSFIPR